MSHQIYTIPVKTAKKPLFKAVRILQGYNKVPVRHDGLEIEDNQHDNKIPEEFQMTPRVNRIPRENNTLMLQLLKRGCHFLAPTHNFDFLFFQQLIYPLTLINNASAAQDLPILKSYCFENKSCFLPVIESSLFEICL